MRRHSTVRKCILTALIGIGVGVCGTHVGIAAEVSKNLLSNSSFTQCTNPGIPDYWGTDFGRKVENWTGCYGIDEQMEPPIKGVKCLRVSNPMADAPMGVDPYWGVSGGSEKKERMFSVYIKGEEEGFPVKLIDNIGHITKVWSITKEWIRYDAPVETSRLLISIEKKGTVWLAAPQLELGKETTQYQPSGKDVIVVDNADVGKEIGKAIYGIADESPDKTLPHIQCLKISSPVVIDGKLDEPFWAQAKKAGDFKTPGGATASVQTEVYTAYDQSYLYIAFRCHEPDMNKLKADIPSGRDRNAYNDDSVEVFLMPEPNSKDYYQFAANINDAQYDSKKADASWNIDWKSAAQKGNGEWTIEIAFPFYELPVKNAKSPWRINFCRNRRADLKNPESSSWSCTFGKFHNPAKFGWLEGLESASLEKFCWDFDQDVFIKKSGDNTLSLQGAIIQSPAGKNEVTVEVEISSAGEKPEMKQKTVSISPPITTFQIDGFSTAWAEKKSCVVQLSLKEAASGNPARRMKYKISPKSIRSMLKLIVEDSFYTKDEYAALLAESGFSSPVNLEVTLRNSLTGAEFKLLKDPVLLAGQERKMIKLPISNLPEAEYEVIGSVYVNGEKIEETRDMLVKYPANAVEVRVNRIDRNLMVNNEPFFYFSTYIEAYTPGTTDWYTSPKNTVEEWQIRDLKNHGFTTMTYLWHVTTGKELQNILASEHIYRRFLDLCLKNEIKVIPWFYLDRKVSYLEFKDTTVALIKKFKDHPAILAWNLLDEQECWWEEANKSRKESDILDFYKEIKHADPYRPAYYNGVLRYDYGGREATDIGSGDYYAFFCFGDNNVNTLADKAISVNKLYKEVNKPCHFWIQMYGWWDAWREPTPSEMKVMSYLQFIYGTRLFDYFRYKPMYAPLWESTRILGEELKALDKLTSFPAKEMLVEKKDNVYLSLWQNGKSYYLITINGNKQDADIRFNTQIRIGEKISHGELLFEKQSAAVENNVLTDRLLPLQTRVYRLWK
ncbi:MAG: sugar-binding protein [Victivallales bacterium]